MPHILILEYIYEIIYPLRRNYSFLQFLWVSQTKGILKLGLPRFPRIIHFWILAHSINPERATFVIIHAYC